MMNSRVGCAMKKLARLRKDDKGVAMAMTAVVLPMLIGIFALVVDTSMASISRTRMDNVALEAARAAALRLPDTTSAQEIADKIILSELRPSQTWISNLSYTITFPPGEVRVDMAARSRAFFAQILGANRVDLASSAVVAP